MRASIEYLVSFVAVLVNDTSYDHYSEDQIQDALDAYRWEATQDPIYGIARNTASGTAYSAYQTTEQWRYWELDTIIEDTSYATLTPDDDDFRNGRWQFDTPRTDSYLYITGFSHDPYAAAHSLLLNRAAMVSEEPVSWSTDGGSFNYGTLTPAISQQAKSYWLQSRAAYKVMTLTRTDVNVF